MLMETEGHHMCQEKLILHKTKIVWTPLGDKIIKDLKNILHSSRNEFSPKRLMTGFPTFPYYRQSPQKGSITSDITFILNLDLVVQYPQKKLERRVLY
jgi:hypothetical protein